MKFKNRLLVVCIFSLAICLNATVIGMRIPDVTMEVGDIINIPVYADSSLTGEEIYSYQLQINFEVDIIFANEIIVDSTIGEPFGIPFFNNSVPGQITIAAAGTVPLSGIGEFLYIQFEILQSGSSLISFTGEENNFFNEGTPSIIFENGSISNPTSVTNSEIDQSHLILHQNYPNPFKHSTTISFALNAENIEDTKVVIYNLKGQKVKTLDCGNSVTATSTLLIHSTQWDGTDDLGLQVANGIYFYQIQDNEASASKINKLILLK